MPAGIDLKLERISLVIVVVMVEVEVDVFILLGRLLGRIGRISGGLLGFPYVS